MTGPAMTPDPFPSEPMDCGHPSGCECVRYVPGQVPCGTSTAVLCHAHAHLMEKNNLRGPLRGAPSHSGADLLGELRRMGYVLARVPKEDVTDA